MSDLGGAVKRAWPVLVAYGVFSLWGLGCLFMSLALSGKGGFSTGGGGWAAAFAVLAATVIGHLVGNLLGLLRLRLMVVVLMFVVLFIGSTMLGAVMGGLAGFMIIAVVATLSGYLGIASRLDVVAAWFPLSLAISGALFWLNSHGVINTFRTGAKHAIWDPFSIICLAGSIFLLLVFLATRHAFGLSVWQALAGRGAQRGAGPGQPMRASAVRPGGGSLIVLFMFTLVVLAASAAISPYLFRTVESKQGQGASQSGDQSGEEESGTTSKGQQGQAQGQKGQGQQGQQGQGQQGQGQQGQGQQGQGQQGQGQQGQGQQGQGQQGQGQQGQGQQGQGQHGQQGQGKGSQSSQQGQGKGGQHGQGKQGQGKQGQGTQGQGKQGQGQASQGQQGQGGESAGGGKEGDIPPPDTKGASKAAEEAAWLAFELMKWFLLLAVIALIFGLVFFPPARRSFLLKHLERPKWPVPPTSRVMNLWRRAVAALGDAGIHAHAGETPSEFALRAERFVRETLDVGVDGLHEAAAMVEKIAYAGRGLGPGEEQRMRAIILAFVKNLERATPMKQKVSAAWGRPPDVEA